MSNPKLLSTLNMVGQHTSDKNKGIKKVAIQREGYFPILYDVQPEYSMEFVVSDICGKWTLEKPDTFALQYLDTKIYVTEENSPDIRDGALFTLTFNPEITAANFLSDIEQPDLAVKRKALKDLAFGVNDSDGGQADDPLFAKEFINRNGINTLKNIVESAVEPGDIIACAMSAIQQLLEHQFTTWEGSVSQHFVEKVIDYANKIEGDVRVVQKALSLLDNMVTVSTAYFVMVMNKVNSTNLVKHLSNTDENVKLNTVALCNSILSRMEHNNRKKFTSDLLEKGYLSGLHKIVASAVMKPLIHGMNRQLYVSQFLMIGLYHQHMNQKPDFGDQKVLADLNKLYNLAFETAPSSKGTGKADFTRLGFQHGGAPLIDFEECPPGVLAYDVMLYFAEKRQDQYIKVILENFGRDSDYECPFGKCTKHLTKILCELLEVGATMSDTSMEFQPMVFSTPNILEELYCVSIQLLNKTWKEMRATTQDFSRVIGVVKDQLKRVLTKRPDNVDKFKSEAFALNYQSILQLMQAEAQERTILDSQTKPVIELRQQIEPEIRDLVRQQRLARLVEGTKFSLYSARGKQKNVTRLCCLSPNHRFLHYGDAESSTNEISADNLPNKIPLSDVTRIDVGKDCPNIKNLKKGAIALAFSVFYGQEEHLDFIAPNEELFAVWTDTLSFLLGKEKSVSSKFKEDLEMLVNMEMKLLLLDLENVRIPDVPPQIPPEPDNYNFYYPDN